MSFTPDNITIFKSLFQGRQDVYATHWEKDGKSGYIESWGRGTLKMIKECIEAKIPQPLYYYDMSGFFVEFRKDIFSEKYLKSLGINERQERAILFIKERGKISNSEYQELNNISKATATRDLSELVEKFEILRRAGDIGAGTIYVLIGS